MGRLHISLDDVKGIFKVLAEDSMDSIFETRTLAFLNKMHELYGMQIRSVLYISGWKFFPGKVSEKYVDEFRRNQNWLTFGFHCYDENLTYDRDNLNDFQRHFDRFQKTDQTDNRTKKILLMHLDCILLGAVWKIADFSGKKALKHYLQPMMTVQAIILMGFKWNN